MQFIIFLNTFLYLKHRLFLVTKPLTSIKVPTPNTCFCLIFLHFLPFYVCHAKNIEKHIWTSVWCAQHPNADQNIQQEGCFVMPGKCFPTFSFPLKWVGGKPIKNHITDPKWQERGRIWNWYRRQQGQTSPWGQTVGRANKWQTKMEYPNRRNWWGALIPQSKTLPYSKAPKSTKQRAS